MKGAFSTEVEDFVQGEEVGSMGNERTNNYSAHSVKGWHGRHAGKGRVKLRKCEVLRAIDSKMDELSEGE